MIHPRSVPAFGLVLLLAACPSPERAQEGTAELPGTSGTATAIPASDAVRVPVQGVGGSAITGEVTLREVGGQSSVQFTVMEAPINAMLEAHLHEGSCAQQGPVAAELDPIITDPSGLGTSVTTVELPLASLTDGRHYVEAHEPGDEPGATLACADIPAQEH